VASVKALLEAIIYGMNRAMVDIIPHPGAALSYAQSDSPEVLW